MSDEADQSLTTILEKTPISALQELATKYRLPPPRYENIKIEGVVHSPTFTFRVTVGELVIVSKFTNTIWAPCLNGSFDAVMKHHYFTVG